ncbi:MAG TPA: hypothetical protein VK060_05250 [Ruania sp.]|nr:hypothetical protein [Ruania sp.]
MPESVVLGVSQLSGEGVGVAVLSGIASAGFLVSLALSQLG